MNAKEFKEIIIKKGWNQRETARRLGIDLVDVNNFANGKKSIPSHIEKYLKTISKND